MPATLQPVIVTPSLPLLLAFYKALLGAVEISRMPEDGPAFYVGLQLGNAELGVVADGAADVTVPQRILLNVNVADLGVGDVEGLLEHVEALGGIQAILITNSDHVRGAAELSATTGARVWGPALELDRLGFLDAHAAGDSLQPIAGLEVFVLHGSKTPGELARTFRNQWQTNWSHSHQDSS